jgi:hypothetical protein
LRCPWEISGKLGFRLETSERGALLEKEVFWVFWVIWVILVSWGTEGSEGSLDEEDCSV